jgi:hypothetical protein
VEKLRRGRGQEGELDRGREEVFRSRMRKCQLKKKEKKKEKQTRKKKR